MAPEPQDPVEEAVVDTNGQASKNKPAASSSPQDEEEGCLAWFQKYKIFVVIMAVVLVIVAIVLIAVGTTGDGFGGSSGSKNTNANVGDDPTTNTTTTTTAPTPVAVSPAPPTSSPTMNPTMNPTMEPTTSLGSLDTNKDGLATFECDEEPYFDRLGRLIFTSCDVN